MTIGSRTFNSNDLLAQLERAADVEAVASAIRPGEPPPEIVVQVKLRRVLLLQDGTHAGIHDVGVARINSVTERKRERERWYERITGGVHPTQLLIGHEEHHGTRGVEAYVDLMSISTINKGTILRREGQLTEDEMREVSDRVITALELDVSAYVEQLHPE